MKLKVYNYNDKNNGGEEAHKKPQGFFNNGLPLSYIIHSLTAE